MRDEEIIELYWARSEDAVKETDQKYGAMCKSISYNILFNSQDAEECVNDTYLQAWNVIPPERPRYFAAFLGKIVRNISLNKYRDSHRKKRGGEYMTVLLSELSECIADGRTVEEKVEETVEYEHLVARINTFLNTLSKRNRAVFVRRYWYADSIQNISRLSGLKEGQIKTILFRCRKKLREMLEEGGVSY